MSVLSVGNQKQVEELLVSEGILSVEQVTQYKSEAESKAVPFFSYLLNEQYLSDEKLTQLIANVTKVPYVNLLKTKVNQHVLDLLPQEIASRYMAVPLGEMQNTLVVAMLDAENVQAADFLSNKVGRPIKVYKSSEQGIRSVLSQYDANVARTVSDSLSQSETLKSTVEKSNFDDSGEIIDSQIKSIVQDSPISKALTSILEYAAENGASDVHMEPLEHDFKIRARVDGVLREVMRLSKSFEPPMVSRIKILANLKIDEHRIPQDGQFTVRVHDRNIDLRIAISPVVWGEQVVIRLLDRSGGNFNLEKMGYTGRALQTIRFALTRPNGMILTSGPTGSGKTTSLYALLQEIKSNEINVVTLEDPVEYKMDGANQIQVNQDVGLTFATGLRSILRQDPDVVMVGEIRDRETASLAVQAALTGHLVFSTLHTNSAAGILPRLLDMGIEPFLIASTVHTVIGQRLVRKLGKNKEAYQSSAAETEAINTTIGHLLPESADTALQIAKDLGYENLPLRGQKAYTLYKATVTADSPESYKGRLGIYEVFQITDPIAELILKRATSADIQRAAQAQGMVTMREDGYLKALAGQTTISEVNRVAATDTA